MHKNYLNLRNNHGFTIVELLVVIVIIGILAAITIVSYVDITNKANIATVQLDLTNAAKKLNMYYAEHGTYPSDIDNNKCPITPVDNNYCLKASNGSSFAYYSIPPYQDFSLVLIRGSLSYKITKDTSPVAITESTFAKTWGGVGDETANTIISTSDGGYLASGSTQSYGAGGVDALLIKYDTNGNVVWSKVWGGIGDDYTSSIISTSDGGYLASGYTNSYGSGETDALLIKYDASGNVVWSKVWGGASDDATGDVISTSDGGYLASGYTKSYGSGGADALLIKYDASGNVVWSKVWGGASDDSTNNIISTSDGDYLASGYTMSYGSGDKDALLIKYDNTGNVAWSKTLGGVSIDNAMSVIPANDIGYIVSGATMSYGDGGRDALLLKFSANCTMANCITPMCQSPTGTVTSPTGTVSSPTGTVSSPTGTVSSPTGVVSSPTGTVTTVVAP